MFPESKVTEIYCMADDFCKEFTLQQEKYMIKDMKTMHRNKPNRMSDAEIMVILILFHSGGFRCFKVMIDALGSCKTDKEEATPLPLYQRIYNKVASWICPGLLST